MPNTQLLAKGSLADLGPDINELAQLDVSAYRTVRLSVGNGEGSPVPVTITAVHLYEPNTPGAAVTVLDSFTVAPGEWVSNAYEVPGEVIQFQAFPEQDVGGIGIVFTIYGRTD